MNKIYKAFLSFIFICLGLLLLSYGIFEDSEPLTLCDINRLIAFCGGLNSTGIGLLVLLLEGK